MSCYAQVWLIFANQTEEDILVRKELEECQAQNPGRFHLWCAHTHTILHVTRTAPHRADTDSPPVVFPIP